MSMPAIITLLRAGPDGPSPGGMIRAFRGSLFVTDESW